MCVYAVMIEVFLAKSLFTLVATIFIVCVQFSKIFAKRKTHKKNIERKFLTHIKQRLCVCKVFSQSVNAVVVQ